ncbi:Prohead protease [uncultured Caudovirales phage]|uniref:Prohead protease n=3 Tax=uncultured Caudovirales phage TaxID=2100421 RepID=A0A6J5PFE5_9CAUD|nr:Prohead protease [uncultured Caudovirales phage]
MKVTTPFTITAADSEARTITGQIVAFDTAANASTGKVMFKSGSIEPANVKLNLEHDSARPIGKTLKMELSPDGKSINATFKISKTTAGSDAIQEAMDGLRDGFSVEANAKDFGYNEDGTMVVNSAELVGVALTHNPAFDSARVSNVAATTAPENSESSTDEAEAQPQQPTEGDVVENTVTEPTAAETVEASAPIQAASIAKPVNFIATRNPVVSPETFLFHKVAAARGDEQSRAFIAAATSSADNPGLIPTRQLREVVNGLSDNVRASIDSISTGTLPDAGLVFQIPKVTQLPAVDQVDELGTVTPTELHTDFIDVDVKSFKGSQIMSVELADRSDPLFYQELISTLTSQYARATNAYNSAQIITGSTKTATGIGTDITAAEFLTWVAGGAVSVYSNTFKFADAIVVSPAMWGRVMSFNDAGRPIYNAINPMNAAGNAQPRSLRGSVNGIDLWVDTALSGTGSNSMYVINRDAYTWYESPRLELRTNVISDGSIGILMYGYGATATKIAAGSYAFNAS